MMRTIVIVLFLSAAGLFAESKPAEAKPPISPNNPYRSATLSGINYGSMNWEQQHNRSSSGRTYYRSRRR